SLQNKIDVEKQQIGTRRDADIDRRAKKLEEDLAALEADGGTAQAKKKLRDTAEKEMDKLRRNADREIDRIEQVWDRFKNLKVNDLEGDEGLYREMFHRFGLYFTGAMGAEAIQKRLMDFDLEAEAEKLRDRKSTRLNSSHVSSSSAVFCLKKKKTE